MSGFGYTIFPFYLFIYFTNCSWRKDKISYNFLIYFKSNILLLIFIHVNITGRNIWWNGTPQLHPRIIFNTYLNKTRAQIISAEPIRRCPLVIHVHNHHISHTSTNPNSSIRFLHPKKKKKVLSTYEHNLFKCTPNLFF